MQQVEENHLAQHWSAWPEEAEAESWLQAQKVQEHGGGHDGDEPPCHPEERSTG